MTATSDAARVLAMIEARLRASGDAAYLLLFDDADRLTGFLAISDATPSAPTLFVARVAQVALSFGAAGVLLVQGSSGGDGPPTSLDAFVGNGIAAVLDALGIRLADHLLVGPRGTTSLAALREAPPAETIESAHTK